MSKQQTNRRTNQKANKQGRPLVTAYHLLARKEIMKTLPKSF